MGPGDSFGLPFSIPSLQSHWDMGTYSFKLSHSLEDRMELNWVNGSICCAQLFPLKHHHYRVCCWLRATRLADCGSITLAILSKPDSGRERYVNPLTRVSFRFPNNMTFTSRTQVPCFQWQFVQMGTLKLSTLWVQSDIGGPASLTQGTYLMGLGCPGANRTWHVSGQPWAN